MRRSFKLFWKLHKWTGIVLSAVVVCTAVTGFLLLIKKRAAWIQPATMTGAAGDIDAFVPLQDALAVVLAEDHPDFRSHDDIDRVDVRPHDRVYKVRSRHHHAEIQVCAITGEVLGVAERRSDLFEEIHDGSFFGGWVHDWIMPLYAVALGGMVGSGLWLWVEPKLNRRRRRRRARNQRP